jgi:hypothetical protein
MLMLLQEEEELTAATDQVVAVILTMEVDIIQRAMEDIIKVGVAVLIRAVITTTAGLITLTEDIDNNLKQLK